MKYMRSISLVLVGLWAAPVYGAVDADAAGKMMTNQVNKALDVLRDPKMQGYKARPERWKRIRTISDEVFDWGMMAQRSLGVHWRKLDDKQRNRFVSVFSELIAAHYLGQIDGFQGKETLTFKNNEATKKGAVWVNMELLTQSRQKIPIAFLVGEGNRVHDVKIESISITSHYRGSLNRLFVNGTFEAAMKKLEAKAAANRRIAAKRDK